MNLGRASNRSSLGLLFLLFHILVAGERDYLG